MSRDTETAPVAAQPMLEQAASRVVVRLAAAEIRHLVIGSFALRAIAPALVTSGPRDLDLLLPDDLATLGRAADCLVDLGYALSSWQEPLVLPLDGARLEGRFYLRAIRDSFDPGAARDALSSGAAYDAQSFGATPELVIVDLTYECPCLDFAAARRRAVLRPPFLHACLADQLTLLAARGRPRDHATIAQAHRLYGDVLA